MENPCLTFVTPTLLAGDRSLVDVVAHEIAHSWMGNLVTTMNWEHFWLNEGFTMLIERKIIERMHGKGEADFSAIIGYFLSLDRLRLRLKALQESVDLYTESREMDLTRLVPTLDNVDPDDAFSSIPYEKGFNFLFYLETLLGGPKVFEPFLRAYVTEFAGKSIETSDFKSFLFSYFQSRDVSRISLLDSVDWDTWFYGYGKIVLVLTI
jgi:leukotriene-A4 hydrolase